MLCNPSRKDVWKMFDAISPTYDKANRWMTLGLDKYWRKQVSKKLPRKPHISLLDCATGTADQLLSLLRSHKNIERAVGVDLSQEMLQIAKKKAEQTPFSSLIELERACILALPFPKETFDCVTLSFGIRNVEDPLLCLQEIRRVLKPSGKLLILETSLPQSAFLRALHSLYLRKLLPYIGGRISRKKEAYEYLQKTTQTFPCGMAFCDLLLQAGFHKASCQPLTGGVVSIYDATKGSF